MNIRLFRLFALAATLFYITPSLFAQSTAFTYQGRLNDGSGPANGTYDLTFALHSAANGATQVGGLVTKSSTPVSNGLFTVTVDFGDQFPGADRWLEVAVRTNGGGAFATLAPRQALASTPYALRAAQATSYAGTVAAGQITGTIPAARLPAAVVTNGASGVSLSGAFIGNGAGMTNLSVPMGAVISGGAITWGGFALASSPRVGIGPLSVAAADVNGDGWMDLISANQVPSSLTVLTNNGSGGFALASTPGVASVPYSVTAADVNGDGRVDLISANFSASSLTVLTNNGSGGFAQASSPGVGNGPFSVTAADVNGDSRVDLISANFNASSLTVLTNDGSGGFAQASSPNVGNSPDSVVAVDVNGDGRVDLISANANANTLTVLTNNGGGGFALASSPGVGNAPQSVTAADANGDGRVDMISANYNSSTLTVLTNDGSGGFALASSLGMATRPSSVVAADVNGDGRVDLISAHAEANTLTVLTNNGSGGFAVASSPGVGNGPSSVVAADVNGDGRVDLISANVFANTLTVLFNTPTFAGNGSALTALNASNLDGGTVADARLSANVALRTGGNTFTGHQTVTGGNVGIGTSAPGARLHVVGSGFFGNDLGSLANGVGPGVRVFRDTASGNGQVFAYHYTAGQALNLILQEPGGNVGVGTTAPQARLDVGGTFRVNGGTTYNRILSGTFAAGSSGTTFKVVTNAFPAAFAGTPALVATALNDPNSPDVNDTFAVSVRSITVTNFVLNIQRVDGGGSSWGQNLLIHWHAWQ